MWKIRDPSGRCPLSAKYFRHMTEVYKKVMTANPVSQETEVNETVYPERYIPDINMVTCKPSLVVKNWSNAVRTFPSASQKQLCNRLNIIFAKYAKLANLEQPPKKLENSCNDDDVLSISDGTSSDNNEQTDSLF